MSATKQSTFNLRALLVGTIFSAGFYGFMEWLFFVTKPSSLSILSNFEKARILFVTTGVAMLAALALLATLSIPALLFRKPFTAWLVALAPAFFFTITALLLFDNFTYTVFKFGIVTTGGLWRIPYTLGVPLCLGWITVQVHKRISKRRKPASLFALAWFVLSLAAVFSAALAREVNAPIASADSFPETGNRPNIIIMGGDGLSAHYLSLYGYNRDTTPFLSSLARTSLLADNAFVNASSTTASTTTMLTGREPATVKVYRYPDILKGDDSFLHLPGILKRQGYHTIEIGTPYYVDAQKLNLLDGFDIVNNQSLNQPVLNLLRAGLGNSPATYFLWDLYGRISERLLHIFFIREMQDPLKEVNNPQAKVTDEQRVDQILAAIDQSTPEQPVFVFTHLMDTHGPHFNSNQHVFSTGDGVEEEWDKDRYQDAILSFDGSVKRVYDHLVETGQLNNTILVVYTDHGFQYTTQNRIPIVIHFPKLQHVGRRTQNIQVIDVAPTLLEYLNLPQPAWMTGRSFLNGETPSDRRIISIVAGSPSKIKPPFYQIKIIQVVVCSQWYQLNVQENKFDSGTPRGHTNTCPTQALPRSEEIRQQMLDYLEKYGYDVSTLK